MLVVLRAFAFFFVCLVLSVACLTGAVEALHILVHGIAPLFVPSKELPFLLDMVGHYIGPAAWETLNATVVMQVAFIVTIVLVVCEVEEQLRMWNETLSKKLKVPLDMIHEHGNVQLKVPTIGRASGLKRPKF